MLSKAIRFHKIPAFFIAFLAFLIARPSPTEAGLALQNNSQEELRLPEKETLVYRVEWLGMPVGTATASINGIKNIEGRQAYELIITARTNDFCSHIYEVDDRYVSYLDVKELYTLRYEVHRREGRYKKDALTNFDQVNHKAYFKNFLDKSEKTIVLPPRTQDLVSIAYYFRLVPVRVGEQKDFFVYNNESVYNLYCIIDGKTHMNFPYVGSREAYHVQPYAKLKGEEIKKGKANGYFTTDPRRLPVMAIVKGPVFSKCIGYLMKEKR